MSINDLVEKIKPFYTLLLCLVIASIFFALGRLSVLEERHSPIKIIKPENSQTASVVSALKGNDTLNTALVSEASAQEGEVIGSKSGKKYYYPWCGTLKRVKPENQVHFDSIELARAAGYTPAGNCKGLK